MTDTDTDTHTRTVVTYRGAYEPHRTVDVCTACAARAAEAGAHAGVVLGAVEHGAHRGACDEDATVADEAAGW